MKLKIDIRSDKVVLEGYVNATEKWSRVLYDKDIGRFRERVDPGVFSRAMERNPNTTVKFNHEKDLGTVDSGAITLREDAIGLYAIAETDDADVRSAAENGQLKGWSFGMTVNADEIDDGPPEEPGIKRRTLKDIDLPEVSILTKIPAYIATTIVQRRDSGEEVREIEDESAEPPEEPAPETEEEHDESRAFFMTEIQKKKIEIIKLRGEKE